MKHSSFRTIIVFIILSLLLAGGVLFFVFFKSVHTLYCSASQPRPSGVESWDKVTASATSLVEPDESVFDNINVSSDEQNFIVEYGIGIGHASYNPFAFEVRQMPPGETLDIGTGTLSLHSIGTAYPGAAQNLENDAVYRFYDARLQEITDERLKVIETFGTTEAGKNFRYVPFPAVALLFEHNGIEDLMFQGVRVFDSTTKKELTGGYSSNGRPAHHRFITHVPLWHRAPVDVVLEVSYGPSKTFEFAPRAGEGFREGNLQCRLMCVFEGVDPYSSNSTSSSNTVVYKFPKARPDQGGSRFVFACQPTSSKMPVTFEFLDADGNVLTGGGSSSSGLLYSVSVKGPLEKVALIRARCRDRRQRILIHLPYIPGLPQENDRIDNLFDVLVPHVKFPDDGQVGEFLRRVLQLNSIHHTGLAPATGINSMPFPREFRNATLRDIARLYAKGGDLYVDISSERLTLEYPMSPGDKLKQFLQKMFGR